MNNNFVRALAFVLREEGGYSNNRSDSGGETNFGITHATYDIYRRSKNKPCRSVRLIDSSEVKEIYTTDYWEPAGCTLLPSNLALCHFDWAVNHGILGATKTLQQVLGVREDGVIGSSTKQALTAAMAKHKEIWLCSRYNAIREGCYRRWGVGSQSIFLKGWLNRLNALRNEINH